ncbi:MAG: amidohydrolase family protein [Parvibaculaceae bacterium]
MKSGGILIVKGGRVYDHDGDRDDPPVTDVLIVDGRIAAIRPGIADAAAHGGPIAEAGNRRVEEVIDATDKLVMPGFVNAHYHSHDVLLKGRFETIPLELWFLNALPPGYGKRSRAEIRARTLLGAVECLRGGITTVQDFATVYPFSEEYLDTILQAYEDIGIRCIFALQIADIPALESVPFWKELVPAEYHPALLGAAAPQKGVDPVKLMREAVRAHRNRNSRISWALGPSSPERCSEALLRSIGELAGSEDLPVYTHLYESKAMTLIGRQKFVRDGGSLVNYLKRVGLLSPRMSLAHSVWMSRAEIDTVAEAGANIVLNPLGNLKTRSGVPPIRSYMERGVNTALGCDNCSCGDAQNMFESMRLFTVLAAVSNPEPGPPTAADAIRSATIAGARTAGLESRLGALKAGMEGDLSILDLSDPSFVPLNSAARQFVFTEAGRSVETVVVGGRVVVRDRKVTTIDEQGLREEIKGLMRILSKDIDAVMARNELVRPHIMEAWRRTWAADIGLNRYVGDGND